MGVPAKQLLRNASKPGALDLHSGSRAVARALLRNGCLWVITYDFDHGPEQDLLDEDNRHKVEPYPGQTSERFGNGLTLQLFFGCCDASGADPAVA